MYSLAFAKIFCSIPAMPDFASFCAELVASAKRGGWQVLAERTIPYGRQYEMADNGGARASLNCYHGKKGLTFVTGGKSAEALAQTLGGGAPRKPEAPLVEHDPFHLGFPRIGGDESGKGDYFGPLVVAAYYVEEGDTDDLITTGIADCKQLSDAAVLRLAGKLDERGGGNTISLMPAEYNQRYEKTRNLNLLLAELHAECVRALLRRQSMKRSGVVLIDQFAREEGAVAQALRMPPGWKLMTRTKAEVDVAVAAASILARASFLKGLKELRNEYGQEFPPGSGEPTIKAARSFKRSCGAKELVNVAKLHFATTGKL